MCLLSGSSQGACLQEGIARVHQCDGEWQPLLCPCSQRSTMSDAFSGHLSTLGNWEGGTD